MSLAQQQQQAPVAVGGGQSSMGEPGAPLAQANPLAQGAPGQGQTPSFDVSALAGFVQQFQKQQQQQGGGNSPPGLQEAIEALLKQQQQQQQQQGGGAGKAPTAPGGGGAEGQDGGGASDPQALMEQISHLTKSLENEKTKSKALQEEKKREMKGFLDGIRSYVQNLDGVKDPNAKAKFMQGMESMADNGLPNGVYDIMVSASAQNEAHMKTIEALTKGYSELKDRYEGAGGRFAKESSRFVDPTIKIVEAGSKRKTTEQAEERVPMGMWDAFGEDIAKMGYSNQADLLGV